jgi:hypothetical protein
MSDPLAWIAAIGGVAATAGTWLGPIRSRWQLRSESQRNSRALQASELHRQRFMDVWHWWHDQPDSPQRVAAIGWFYEWTGARAPFDNGRDGPQAPGTHSPNAAEAYERYLDFLSVQYRPNNPEPSSGMTRRILRRTAAIAHRTRSTA